MLSNGKDGTSERVKSNVNESKREREREREREKKHAVKVPRAHARKTIMMDKLRLVPHVRSERKRVTEGTCSRQGPGEEGARKEEADRKRGRRKREESDARIGGRQEECRRVFRSIPPFYGVPLHSCRYAAHPRISSPLGSHVIERSPSRGETQPIHILCSPPCIP